MASVFCSSKLYRALAPGSVSGAASGAGDNVLLAGWAATRAGREFMVVIDARTCLTLVVRLLPVTGFRDRLAAALRLVLEECGVSPDAIERECEALGRARFLSRRHPTLREAMTFAEMEAGAHAEDGQPEDSVQSMLNTYPYGECETSCPIEAVCALFGAPSNPVNRRAATRRSRGSALGGSPLPGRAPISFITRTGDGG
jgi:hypothetical protein